MCPTDLFKTPFLGLFAENLEKFDFKTPFLGFFALFLRDLGYEEGKIFGKASMRKENVGK